MTKDDAIGWIERNGVTLTPERREALRRLSPKTLELVSTLIDEAYMEGREVGANEEALAQAEAESLG